MVVGAAGDQGGTPAHQPVGEGLGVVGNPLGVRLERRLAGFGEGHRLGRDHMFERAAEHHRAALVDGVGVFGGGQHQTAARPAQRLVRGAGDDVGVRHRILVTGEHLPGDQPGEMRHIDHQSGADLVGDLTHGREVDPARVGRIAGDQDQRSELPGRGGDGVVVEQTGGRVGAVAALLEHLAGDVRPEPVREVTAGVQRHSHQALAAELGPQPLPLRLGQVIDVLDARLTQCGHLHPGGQDCPERHQVGVDTRVRLNVGVRGAEQLAGMLSGDRLHLVDVLAAGIEPVPDGALGVLVRQPGSHGQQHRGRGVVLAGDQFQRFALVGQLLDRRRRDPRFHGFDDPQRRPVGLAGGGGIVGAGGLGGQDGVGRHAANPSRRVAVRGTAAQRAA